MGYYSGQIHIRNALNDIQNDLYGPAGKSHPIRSIPLD